MRLLLIVALLLAFLGSPASAETWVEVGQSPEATSYLDTDSLRVLPNGEVEFLQKIVWTEEYYQKNLEQFLDDPEANHLLGSMYQGITTYRYEPATRRTRMVWIRGYDRNGKLLEEGVDKDTTWQDTAPGSNMEHLLDVLDKTLAERPAEAGGPQRK